MKSMVMAWILVVAAAVAAAQPVSKSSGTIKGTITEKATKAPAVGATIVATSKVLVGEQVQITDEKGEFAIASLPPGTYTLTIYYDNQSYAKPNVVVKAGAVATVKHALDVKAQPKSEIVEIVATPEPPKPKPFTITGPDFTLTRDENRAIKLEKSGKLVTTANATDHGTGIEMPDGTRIYATQTDKNPKVWEINTHDGKEIGTVVFPKGELQLVGKKKRVRFDAKGALVGGAVKLTIKPASATKHIDAMLIVAALLRDQI